MDKTNYFIPFSKYCNCDPCFFSLKISLFSSISIFAGFCALRELGLLLGLLLGLKFDKETVVTVSSLQDDEIVFDWDVCIHVVDETGAVIRTTTKRWYWLLTDGLLWLEPSLQSYKLDNRFTTWKLNTFKYSKVAIRFGSYAKGAKTQFEWQKKTNLCPIHQNVPGHAINSVPSRKGDMG